MQKEDHETAVKEGVNHYFDIVFGRLEKCFSQVDKLEGKLSSVLEAGSQTKLEAQAESSDSNDSPLLVKIKELNIGLDALSDKIGKIKNRIDL